MPYKPSFGTLASAGEPLEAPKAKSPFRIGVLADFSGRQNREKTGSSEEIAARRFIRVTRDTLDEVMAKLGVALELPLGDDGVTASLSFAALDDFDPDQVHDKVEQIADLDDADEKSAMMNSVLHNSDFQALESAWRGLDWLLGRAVKGSQVEVMLIDISFAELAADLKASDDLTACGVYQLLIDKAVRGTKGEPWAVLVGNYTFNLSGQHAELLGRLAKIVSQSNAPFISTVSPQVLKKSFALSADAAPAWQALRQLSEAALIGLAVPRFLLRLPYGENTKSIDKFSYEEQSSPPEPSNYLWGNPALACAALLAQAFHKDGWGLKASTVLNLENLPIHVYTVDGDEEVTLAEAWLVRPQTEELVKKGIMPFLCVRGKGAMQLLRFLSLAEPDEDQPACDLQGRWNPAAAGPTNKASAQPVQKAGVVAQMPPAAAIQPGAAPKSASAAAAKVTPAPAPAPPAEEEIEPAAEATPEAPAAAAEEEMDPDLAALLKQLE